MFQCEVRVVPKIVAVVFMISDFYFLNIILDLKQEQTEEWLHLRTGKVAIFHGNLEYGFANVYRKPG